MSLESTKCPNCDAPVTFIENKDYVFCSHCGTQIYNPNKKVTVNKNIDVAKIKEIEYREKKDTERKESLKDKLPLLGRSAILSILFLAVVGYTMGWYILGNGFAVVSFLIGAGFSLKIIVSDLSYNGQISGKSIATLIIILFFTMIGILFGLYFAQWSKTF